MERKFHCSHHKEGPMISKSPKTFDFRYIAVIPVLVGLCMMAFPTLWNARFVDLVVRPYGVVGFFVYAGSVIGILRFNRLPTHFLAKSFFQTWKRNGKFVAVEIEPASTYDKFKLVPDDLGVIYPEGDRIFLETLGEIHDITGALKNIEWIATRSSPKPGLATISIDGSDRKIVLKPVYNKISFKIHKELRLASEWMMSEIHSWIPTT